MTLNPTLTILIFVDLRNFTYSWYFYIQMLSHIEAYVSHIEAPNFLFIRQMFDCSKLNFWLVSHKTVWLKLIPLFYAITFMWIRLSSPFSLS